jgi:hypothetical protein
MAAEQAQSSEPSILDRLLGPMPRWLVYLLVPGFLGPVLILGFIFVSELAHDEARCPYERRSEQRLSDAITVREDARICLPGIEERRFTVTRANAEHVLGRRRFSSGSFEPERYRWQAALSDQGEVRVTVDNDGHAQAVFREGRADERAP